MKYTKLSKKIGSVVLGILNSIPILLLLGAMVALLWIEIVVGEPLISLIWLFILPVIGWCINRFLGYYFGDKYYNTGMVSEGYSVYDVIVTPEYCTRRMFFCFIECFLFIILAIRFIFLFQFNITIAIIGIIGSIIAIGIFFIFGMSSYEQSSIREKKSYIKVNDVKKQKEDTLSVPKKKIFKFNFEKYPELLEKYNIFKFWNVKKYEEQKNDEEKKLVLSEIEKSFESLALAVFNVFNEIKPELTIKNKGKKVKWEEVINKPYQELSYMQKIILVRLLDRLYKYILPDEYYDL